MTLPIPTEDQLAHSALVLQAIHEATLAEGGWISFRRFMDMALYAPGLGYYSAGSEKFGARGDFVTAPEISSLFGRSLARQVAQVLRDTSGDVLELGAGTGRLAVQILQELQRSDTLPGHYLILEVSAHLKQVQAETLARALPDALLQRVEWLDALPESFSGCIVGNEVLDALAPHMVAWHEDGPYERGVAIERGNLVWQERKLVPGVLLDAARALALPPGYVSEINLATTALIASLAEMLNQGALLLVDYGFPRHEYYHPQRTQGTLMCHYRHHAHDDPFLYPGLQDITAHVDFTAVAEAGVAHGMALLGYATQAQFLINCGITELLSEVSPRDIAAYLPLAAEAQKLLSPAEMGELFKVIMLGKGMDSQQVGFVRGDKRHAL